MVYFLDRLDGVMCGAFAAPDSVELTQTEYKLLLKVPASVRRSYLAEIRTPAPEAANA